MESSGERSLRRTLVVAVVSCTLVAVGAPREGVAGTSQRFGSVSNPSLDPAMIAPQLRRSIALQRRAIVQLSEVQDAETMGRVAQLIEDAYVLVRASHHGLLLKIDSQKGSGNRGYVDPMLLRDDPVLWELREHILKALSAVKSVAAGGSTGTAETVEHLEAATEHLEVSIRRIQQVLITVR